MTVTQNPVYRATLKTFFHRKCDSKSKANEKMANIGSSPNNNTGLVGWNLKPVPQNCCSLQTCQLCTAVWTLSLYFVWSQCSLALHIGWQRTLVKGQSTTFTDLGKFHHRCCYLWLRWTQVLRHQHHPNVVIWCYLNSNQSMKHILYRFSTSFILTVLSATFL